MDVKKIDETKFLQIKKALNNYILSWYELPEDIDMNNLEIETIRFIDSFKIENDGAWIVEFETEENVYRELIMEEELNFSIEQFKELLEKENKNLHQMARDVICVQSYYKYPIVYKKE